MIKEENNLPKISIIMPSFNSVDYIERSIRSVVEQDYENIELFIKDGDSTDGTVDIINFYAKKYPKLIKWVSSKDQGQADAINYGMKRAEGEIVSYLNADDVYKPSTLEEVADYFIKNPKVMWVYGKADIIDGDDKKIRAWITAYKNFWLKNYSYNTLLVLNYISQMACFWRREAAENIGKFDVSQHYVMDYDYWLRLGKKYKPGIIDKYLASFRIVSTNKSTTGFVSQFQDEFEVAKKYTKDRMIIFLHKLHSFLIIFIYYLLRVIGINKVMYK